MFGNPIELETRPACPTCANRLNGVGEAMTDVSNRPKKGDITVCGYCASILRFADDTLTTMALVPYAELSWFPLRDRHALEYARTMALRMIAARVAHETAAAPRN